MADVDRFNSAVQMCLDECLGAEAPIARLAEFRERLRRNPEWRERDVDAVERVARRMLEALLKSEA